MADEQKGGYTLLGVLRGHAPAEGVVAYIPKAETCRDTSLLSEYSRAGGVPTPPLKNTSIKNLRKMRRLCEG